MPEGRMVSKSITTSEQLGAVSLQADFLFGRCIPHLDRDGRMTGNPNLIKSTVVPLRGEITPDTIPGLLLELGKAELIRWYESEGKQVVEMPGFKRHQRGAKFDREAPSRFPAFSERHSRDLVSTYSGSRPDKVRTYSGSGPAEVPLREVK